MLMIFTMSMKTWFKNFHFPKIHIKNEKSKYSALKTNWEVIHTDWMDLADNSVHKYDLQASKHSLVWNYLTRHKYTIKWNDSSFWHIFTPITEIDIVHKVLKSEKKSLYNLKSSCLIRNTLRYVPNKQRDQTLTLTLDFTWPSEVTLSLPLDPLTLPGGSLPLGCSRRGWIPEQTLPWGWGGWD